MTSKSKSKGNKLEREMRDFFNNMYESTEFARTPGSGAIMGLSNSAVNAGLEQATKQTLSSDLICPNWFKFSVECKNYAKDAVNYSTIIKGNDKTLDGWLGEACYDAINLKLAPMLIFRTVRQGTHVVLPYIFKNSLDVEYYLTYKDFIVVDAEIIKHNATTLRDFADNDAESIQVWLRSSTHVTELLSTLAEDRRKAGKIAAHEAIVEMINDRKHD